MGKDKKDKKDKKEKKKLKKKEKKEKKEKKRERAPISLEQQEEDKRKLLKMYESGYANSNNPFGDSSLSKQFVWGKKEQADKRKGKVSKAEDRRRRVTNLEEIQQVKRRREERTAETQEREAQREAAKMEKEMEQYKDWEKREEDFELSQKKFASAIRINQGREKPIDVLAKNLLLCKQVEQGTLLGPDGKPVVSVSVQGALHDPLKVFSDPKVDYVELEAQIQDYFKAEKPGSKYKPFWGSMLVVVAFVKKHGVELSGSRQSIVGQA